MNTHDPTNGNGAEHNPIPSPKPSIVCGAKCRNGRTCTQKPMPNGRCRLHGGKTPAGIASPHWRHGRRSKYEKHLPTEMRNGYLAALNDEQITSLRDELALQDTFIQERLEALAQTQAPPWGRAVESLKDLCAALRKGEGIEEALSAHAQVVRTGADTAQSQDRIRAEVRELIQERTRTASAEQKRLTDMGALIEVDKALAFLSATLAALKEEVADRDTLLRVTRRIHTLLPPADQAGRRVGIEHESASEEGNGDGSEGPIRGG